MPIDGNLCGRFIKTLEACFCGEDDRLPQKNVAEKLGISESIISEIKHREKEPSKSLIEKAIINCDVVDPGWIIIGKINDELCRKIDIAFKCLSINLSEASKKLNVSTAFLLGIFNKEITPSNTFIERFCKIYDAHNFIYPQIDEEFRAWFEKTIIKSKIKVSDLSKSLGLTIEYILSVINGEVSFPKDVVSKFVTIYKLNPPVPKNSNNNELFELLRDDPDAMPVILSLLKKRKNARE
jgi:plasmid maintenance system antidote protein VapI